MSRPIQFIPNPNSAEQKQFVVMWDEEKPIVQMMSAFGASRATILAHAARSGLIPRARPKTPRRAADSAAPVALVRKKTVLLVRCEGCFGSYEADIDSVEACPLCGQARGPARRRYEPAKRRAS